MIRLYAKLMVNRGSEIDLADKNSVFVTIDTQEIVTIEIILMQ